MNDDNKKPVGSEEQTQNQLEKTYEKTLTTGSVIKIHITANLNACRMEDKAKVLKKAAECFHGFYLELGTWINNRL